MASKSPSQRPLQRTRLTVHGDGSTPKLIILGRGQMKGRKLRGLRIQPDVIKRLSRLVSGPTYLAVEIAITRFCDALENVDTIEMINAKDLE